MRGGPTRRGDERPFGVVEVVAEQRRGGVAVAGAERGHDGLVALHEVRVERGGVIGGQEGQAHLGEQGVHQDVQSLARHRPDECRMEPDVRRPDERPLPVLGSEARCLDGRGGVRQRG
ncbi:hypothetical protein DEJ23_04605 [Curtobacterium sp. MCSS17_008]|nr:hypothetical protein DEJ23_04605 [Curtobacterium sp. MCSS17_008]